MTHLTYAMSHCVGMHNVPVYSVGQVRQSPASQTAGRRFENSPVSEHSLPSHLRGTELPHSAPISGPTWHLATPHPDTTVE